MSSLFLRLLGVLTVALVAVLGLSAAAGADAGTAGDCRPAVVNAAYTPAASEPVDCAAAAEQAPEDEAVAWSYQLISTDRPTDDHPYLGSPQQQWLVAGGVALALAAVALLRRRLRA